MSTKLYITVHDIHSIVQYSHGYPFLQLLDKHVVPSTAMIGALLLHEAIVACCQASTRPLAIEHHGYNEQRYTQTHESTGNEHILQTISLHPWRNSKGNTNAEGISKECNTGKGVTGDLLRCNIRKEQPKRYAMERTYITVAIDDQGQSGIADTA